jgi:hypothetical protein
VHISWLEVQCIVSCRRVQTERYAASHGSDLFMTSHGRERGFGGALLSSLASNRGSSWSVGICPVAVEDGRADCGGRPPRCEPECGGDP